MSWLENSFSEGDRIYIYLAGHGDAINASEYFFLTYDCKPENDKNNYLATGVVQLFNVKNRLQIFKERGAEVILIIDACRTGDLPGGQDGISTFSNSIAEDRRGHSFMLSAGPGQVAYEDTYFGGGHGVFTYYLIKGLSGHADQDNDGIVTWEEIEFYVRNQVRLASNERYGYNQRPVFCCPEHATIPLSQKDESLLDEINSLSQLANLIATDGIYDLAGRSIQTFDEDSITMSLYNDLNAIISNKNINRNQEADKLIDLINESCNACPLYVQAKRNLSAMYLNFGQLKINTYLSGLLNEVALDSKFGIEGSGTKGNLVGLQQFSGSRSANLSLISQAIAADYSHAARLVKKALEYMEESTEIQEMFYHKYLFLDIRAQINDINPADSVYWIDQISNLLTFDYTSYNHNLAGLVYSKLGRTNVALEHYQTAIELAPNWWIPVNNIGTIYFNHLQNYEEALRWFSKANEMDPHNSIPQSNIKTIQKNMRNFEEVRKSFELSLPQTEMFLTTSK